MTEPFTAQINPPAIANWYLEEDARRGRGTGWHRAGAIADAVLEDFPTGRAVVFRQPDAPHGAPRYAIASSDGLALWRDLATRCFHVERDLRTAPPLTTAAIDALAEAGAARA